MERPRVEEMERRRVDGGGMWRRREIYKESNVIGEGGDSPVIVAAAAKKEGRHQGHPEQTEKKGRVEHHPSPFPPEHVRAPGLKPRTERSLDSSRDQTDPYGPVNGPGQLTLDQLTRVN
ncbi:hypothetical protein Sjap_000782 [Stephania japonica]|uniref:Uncharacterized protein n=1 Tax=Stephania japonica TaxID=461633 RepID=A0AAP0KL34_9MAGN